MYIYVFLGEVKENSRFLEFWHSRERKTKIKHQSYWPGLELMDWAVPWGVTSAPGVQMF